MKSYQTVLVTICIMLSAYSLNGQQFIDDPTSVEYFSFVNYDTNTILHPGGGEVLTHFFSRLDTLIFRGEGQINIIHIGGSHIQTDVYSHQVRKKLQNLQPGMNGGRGLVFPISVTGSNNPRNYSVSWTGRWQHCRNTQRNLICNYGLTGMMAVTNDTLATITISNRDSEHKYNTTLLRVFHFDPALAYSVGLASEDAWLVNTITEYPAGYTEIKLNAPVDTFTLEFFRSPDQSSYIEFYGVQLISDDPGIVYHSLGVNGASIPSFLRANLLQEQLSLINPDLVILSLGTNDGFSKNFDPVVYKNNYIQLIEKIKATAPKADIIITVPNDVYLGRKRPNQNTRYQERVIYELAETFNCNIWNFFQVMGGINSVPVWYRNGMIQKDRIHFTPKGYLLKGDLFFNAIIKSYGNHLEKITEL